MFWQEEMECMQREELLELQLKRLKKTLKHCYENIPFYKKRLDDCGVCAENFNHLDDIKKIPFTTKADLRDNYPFGLFGAKLNEVVRIHGSSGTTGKPTVVGYTRNDMKVWTDLVARVAVESGVTADDIAQVSFGYGLFTGALGLHQGLEEIGVTVVPMSSGNTEKQLMLMQDFGTTVLIATPSYAVYLSEAAKEAGIIDKLKLRVALLGSEACSNEMRSQIEQNFGIMCTDNYGMSEIIGPGVSGECTYRNGLHIAEDHFYAETVNSDTLISTAEGEYGELVFTSLTKEAFPILRYRTKDISRITTASCECGRTLARMEKVRGRCDDMLIIKGVNVFPSQVESVLVGMEHIGPHYLLVLRREKFMDSLEVQVELLNEAVLEKFSELEKIRNDIKKKLVSVLGLDAKVTLVSPKTIERSQGKAKRVLDLRNEKVNR